MNRQPSISVVIPCFNYGRFLSESLASVRAQTVAPVETLIVDDGSTDPDTLEILDRLSSETIRVVHQENRGLASARNTGVRCAIGAYVYFLDPDDLLFPDCLEKLSALLDSSPAAVAACSGVRNLGGDRDGTDWLAAYHPYAILVRNLWAAGIMLRRDAVVGRALWYDETMRLGYEDWEFNIRLTRAGLPVEVFRGALYHYRIHAASMLNSSRRRHAEIVAYIRAKHETAYRAGALLELKKRHAPAVAFDGSAADAPRLTAWAPVQSFQDWTFEQNTCNGAAAEYRLLHDGTAALERLPAEALETAVMALESSRLASCVLAVALDAGTEAVGSAWRAGRCQPVALIFRARSFAAPPSARDLLARGDYILPFADQNPGAPSTWEPLLLSDAARPWRLRDVIALRKRLSAVGETMLGPRLKSYGVRLYDLLYYRLLFSERTVRWREKLRRMVGAPVEAALAKVVYGAFLARPPQHDERLGQFSAGSDTAPLFLRRDDPEKIKILIATAWLNQGGVEQEILDLCRGLDRARFEVTIVTTKRSAHPWATLAREARAAVYHLADSLELRAVPRALAHLILNHRIDVLHIVHSRETYEALGVIKRLCPQVAISDRNVTLGSGFPKLSARAGADHIDMRTAGHEALARAMAEKYGIDRASIRVIYSGTDSARAGAALASAPGRLRALCGIPREEPVVLFLGRLAPEKRPEVFVRAAAEILRLRPDCRAHFVLIGDGESRKKVEATVRRPGLAGRVHMLGFRLDGLELMSDSTLLVIPSEYEGLALVSFEAMALGIPQVSADIGGQSELIAPETGVLIRNGRGEIRRYARAVLELLDDSERRERMAAAGKRRIEDGFTVEKAAAAYGRIFEELARLSRDRASRTPYLKPPHIDPLRAFG
jgi:glycosyltransferase involved in cell wall biosynthesis/GT2 family glycosyltransferase